MKNRVGFAISLAMVFTALFIPNTKAQADTFRAMGPVEFKMSLTNSVPYIGATKAHQSNYKGQNSYVVVIDSGVETTHPFLSGKVALEACFAIKCPDGTTKMIGSGAAKPVHWHGTHVAGIVAGSNSSMSGVAPEAKIIAVNIFDVSGSTFDDNIIQALTWVDSISSQYNIAAVNMSLGTPTVFRTSCNSYIPALTSIISKLKSKDIAVVVSAGNSYAHGMSSPACITDTVSVAATYPDKDQVTSFSNINSDTDLSAPGFNINSSSTPSTYRLSSGTSMAAPHVAGAFAVYRSKFGVQSVDKVVSDFQNTSVPALDDYTKIYSKRIDFNVMFGDGKPPVVTTTTTVPVVTTTTVPRVNPPVTTTTTTVPGSPTTTQPPVEFGLTVPEITGMTRYIHNTQYLYVDFKYSGTLSNVASYVFECTYTNAPNVTKPLPNRGNRMNFYFVRISTASIDSCRMAAVSTAGQFGQFTDYIKVG